MADNLKDILSNLSPDIDPETLLLYLQNKLTADQKHDVEKRLLDNDFASDAEEGLRNIRDRQQISYLVELMNRDLKKKLEKKRQRRKKLRIRDQSWLYLSVIIIIFLIIIAYVVVRMYITNK